MAALKPIDKKKCLCGEFLAPLETQLLGRVLREKNHPIVMPSECRKADCCRVPEVGTNADEVPKNEATFSKMLAVRDWKSDINLQCLFGRDFCMGTCPQACGEVEVNVGILKRTCNDMISI